MPVEAGHFKLVTRMLNQHCVVMRVSVLSSSFACFPSLSGRGEKNTVGRTYIKRSEIETETECQADTNREKQRLGQTHTVIGRWRHRGRDREGCWMCVLHPKGSLTQYRHSTGGQSTTRVHWPKSFLFTRTYTRTFPPSNIPVSTRPLRINRID